MYLWHNISLKINFNMTLRLFTPLLFIVLVTGCSLPEKNPIFKKVRDIRVSKVNGKEALLKGDAYFYNPNDVKLTLRKVNIGVSLDGKKIGTINQSVKTKIQPLSDFKVPVDATFNISEVGVLKSILSVIGGKKMKAQYKGFIKLTYKGLPIKVPVDYEEEIRLR